jgi:hypothetical protein
MEEASMRVMVLVKASPESEAEAMPADWTAGMMAAMGRFNDELRAAGVLIAAEGLQPTARGWRIAIAGDQRQVIEGPFTPARDQLAGYWLWEVANMEEAMAWAMRCPDPMPPSPHGPSQIEIRPLYG